MKRIFDVLWIIILGLISVFLYNDTTREIFIKTTKAYPLLMSFIKFSILATMGELLAKRIVNKKWIIKGTFWYERAFVWGCLGMLFAYVFPIYSAGIDFLIKIHRLPVFSDGIMKTISTAFWKSFIMNILFAFEMMTFHRITDSLIDKRSLFKKWPFLNIWNSIDWNNMWKVVAPTILWFWIPAHTITFCLPAEFRILMAAGLSICLGGILAYSKTRAK